ncbi:copper resistance protein CopC [Candidatus Nitronereus thalassa]|uniref:Copper resistance protein CopC n=1 Tax=Candidatus Nitronereus thalassa TaxID=3020898 RepID=A0ABU3K561_9BACT|nr:copper resistance protein CopC [Candidatus Nitronereus thalassa]MDT7041499.1 copper resistance protein CopC [Candidatus Nitronereus thalassa]
MMSPWVSGLASLLLASSFWTLSWGHGVLIESSPSHGAILKTSPTLISLRFNAALEPSITQVSLVDIENHIQALTITKDSTVERIVATVPPLLPGVYRVNFQVLATDGHVTEGSIRFTILAE